MDPGRPDGDGADASERLSFLGRELARQFQRHVVMIPAGESHAYDEAEWRDAVVMVERGEIELETTSGRRRRFRAGAVLWLVGLSIEALHNPGEQAAVVVGISRQYCCGRKRRSATGREERAPDR